MTEPIEPTAVRHMTDLGRYLTGRDGGQTYTLCDLLRSDENGRVLPEAIPDAPVCEVCASEFRRRQGA